MKYKIGDLVVDKLSGETGIIHSIAKVVDYQKHDFWTYRLAYSVRFFNLKKQYADNMFESIIMSEEELV